MSVKNSAGVKLNDATELIIRADPDGTVESCFNLANNTEYVGGGSSVETASVAVHNAKSASVTMYYATTVTLSDVTYLRGKSENISAGSGTTYAMVVGGVAIVPSGSKWGNITGDLEVISNQYLKVNGAGSADIVNA